MSYLKSYVYICTTGTCMIENFKWLRFFIRTIYLFSRLTSRGPSNTLVTGGYGYSMPYCSWGVTLGVFSPCLALALHGYLLRNLRYFCELREMRIRGF